MHMVIRVIVYASSQEEALKKGKKVLSKLCEEEKFDYYATFDEEGLVVAGKDRWGNLPVVAKLSSKEGKKLISEGFCAMRKEFYRCLNKIRKYLKENSNKQLFEDTSLFRYYCYCLGQYSGSEIWLYNNDGEGIRNTRELKWALNPESISKENIWVVPADVHF